jgi:predicted GH43/DUF377 family glycosyl hydrolase
MQSLQKIYILIFFFLPMLYNTSIAQPDWTKDPANPIPLNGEIGTWNRHVFRPSVLYNSDSTRYEMWFMASDGVNLPNWRPYLVGFAVSSDLVNWSVHPNPVLEPDPGAWDETAADDPMVIRENGTYKMWYAGWSPTNPSGGIGYATSDDGINWTKYSNNPVWLAGTDFWEAGGRTNPNVIPDQEGGYKMWYSGWNQGWETITIGYALSEDGINWQNDQQNNPVLVPGLEGEWDDENVYAPEVLLINGIYCMWYISISYVSGIDECGFAASHDGIHWEKNTLNNPVLSPTPGQWDGDYIGPVSVLPVEDTLHMWYCGIEDPEVTHVWQIGHATLPLDSLLKYAVILDVEEDIATNVPNKYKLEQNYPNPFNPSTTIEFTLPKSEFVELTIYDILSREVALLVSESLKAGDHTRSWDASGFTSGIYYYRIEAGNFVQTRKMIYLK